MSTVEDPGKIELNSGGKYSGHSSTLCGKIGGFLCGCFVIEDCRKDDILQQQSGEDALFCTLCNAEVQPISFTSIPYWNNLVFFKWLRPFVTYQAYDHQIYMRNNIAFALYGY